MRFSRASGILLHPTSLPGRFGIGDFGDAACRFVDFLASSSQSLWQILPLTPTGYGDSPYSAFSAFAGNTLLISPEKLVDDGLLDESILDNAPASANDRVDYGLAYNWKREIIAAAFERFNDQSPLREEFSQFASENSWWLEDYAMFQAVRTANCHKAWFEWDDGLKLRQADALAQVRSERSHEIEVEKFAQFIFFRQWFELKKYANEKGVRIIGDIPIFVALDSADVWCNQDKFKLHPDGRPRVVAGVPPDYFSKTGQRWGNPIYDWDAMQWDGFGWWTARVAFSLRLVDIVRLDHFIGFVRNWEVPADEETAENGRWIDVPGRALLTNLRERLGDLPLIAEDLGEMTPEVESLRDDLGIPGMTILQYAFGGGADNRYLPHHHVQNSIVYTGTHDNDTTAGWYRSAPSHVKSHCRQYLDGSSREMHWKLIRLALNSVADTAIIPAQDLLGLGNAARMNVPGDSGGNWQWRLTAGQLNDDLAAKLREVTEIYGRIQ